MKATEQYFLVVLFIMLYKVVITFQSVDEILWYGHPNGSSSVVLSYDSYYLFYSIYNTTYVDHFNLEGGFFNFNVRPTVVLS